MITKGMMSSNSNEWATPINFYNELNKEFNFTLDPCATDENHKCKKYYTQKQNGLKHTWGGREFIVILLMEEKYLNGWRKHILKTKMERL